MLTFRFKLWGWGFAQVWRRFDLSFFFCLPSSRKRNVQTGFMRRFLVRRFLRPFLRRFLVCRFLVCRFLCRFLVRRFCTDFRADFPQIFLRRFNFGISKKGVPESRKNAQKICGVPMALPGRGTPFHLCFIELTACHTIAARPTHSRRACERPPWHLWAERDAWICSKIFQK